MQELAFNKVIIDLGALKHNAYEIKKKYPEHEVMAVLKGDAYGHGLLECGRALNNSDIDCFGVLDVLEALQLKKNGITKNIYVIAGLDGQEQINVLLENDFRVFIYSFEQLKKINYYAQKLGVQAKAYLKIETGMGRLGVKREDAENFIKAAQEASNITILGLASHLATANDIYAQEQLIALKKILDTAHNNNFKSSILASSGLLWLNENAYGLLRCGIILYGINVLPANSEFNFKPVMSVFSKVIQVRDVQPGESISYGRTYVAAKKMKVAVIPFGYVHGLSRSRSNKGYVLINGYKAPLLGTVCMNLSMYDVSEIDVSEGDEVVILGSSQKAEITAEEFANWDDTIAYEILCLLGRLNYRFFKD